MMQSVYKCRSSFEDSRPQIDFPLPTNAANDWLLIGDVEQGIEEIDQWPKTIALAVNDERASDGKVPRRIQSILKKLCL